MDIAETNRAVALALAVGTLLVLYGLLRSPRCASCDPLRRFYMAYLAVFFVLQLAGSIDVNPFSTLSVLLLIAALHLAFVAVRLRRSASGRCRCMRTPAHAALLFLALAQTAVIVGVLVVAAASMQKSRPVV